MFQVVIKEGTPSTWFVMLIEWNPFQSHYPTRESDAEGLLPHLVYGVNVGEVVKVRTEEGELY